MAQLFSAGADTRVRIALVTAVVVAFFVPFAVWTFARTPAATGQYRAPVQPVPFAHTLHVNGLQLSCRYCHAGVERSPAAGLPPTKSCVPCHHDSVVNSDLFAPVRDSLETGRPIGWRRVSDVPDFVFFNHSAHVQNGVSCDTCHGPVHLMQTVYQAAPLTMEWCLGCHRNPERHLVRTDARAGGWTRGDAARGRAIVTRYDVERLTSCTTCHR